MSWIGPIVHDLRYAARMLRKNPGVAIVAVLSLALGIGANTAIFTMIESTLLRPIPLKDPGRLRLLTWREQWGGWVPPNLGYLSATFGSIYEQRETADGGLMHTDFAPSIYQEFRERNTVFESLFTFKELGRATAVVDGNAEPVNCFMVSGDFYRGLDVAPALGRTIGPQDDTHAAEGSVAVISYEYWTRRFARSASAIGKTITLNRVPLTIIGVNPEYFTGIEPGGRFDVWTPLSLSHELMGRSFLDEPRAWQIPMMGRLKRGVSDAQAQSELDALFQAGVEANPGPMASMLQDPAKRPRFVLASAARGIDYLTQRYDRMLLALFALAGLVLLIACANTANLLLAASAVRQREVSLRLALGAGRARIVQQLLTEGLLLAAMAGIAGVVLGYWARNAIPALLTTPWRPSPFDPAFDPKVLLVSLALTLATGVLFSLAPVWQSRRVEVNEALKDGSRSTSGLSKLRIGRLLVAGQVALCLLLLAGAGLCVKTFANLRRLPLGFEPDRMLLFTVDPPGLHYDQQRIGGLLTEVQRRLNIAAGIQSASFYRVMGWVMGSGFFETMGIPILEGRGIEESDRAGGLPVVVVNETYRRRFFPNESPVGKLVKGPEGRMAQIVGVCADWHTERLRERAGPSIYSAFVQSPRAGPVTFEVRTSGASSEAAIAQEIRQTLRNVDPDLTIADLRTGEQQVADGFVQERLLASLASAFGTLALILAAIGLYGVMAYAVARRTNEIGIRSALGASPAGLGWMVLRETLLLAAAGIAVGVPVAIGLAPVANRLLAPGWSDGFVYGMEPRDPAMLVAPALILAAVGLLAGCLPAMRAMRVDPLTALRHE